MAMEAFFLAETFFSLITFVGHPFFWVIASAVLFWQGKEKESFFLMNLIVVSGIFVAALKNFFMIPRPESAGKITGILEPDFGLSFDRYGFPSGHAATISSAYAFFRQHLSKAMEVFFISLIVAVGYSRVFLERHFALDVAAGIVLGLAIGKLVGTVFERFSKTRTEKLVAEKELGLVLMGFVFLAVLFFLESLEVFLVVFGYYFGLFLFKFLGFDSTEVKGKKLGVKIVMGLSGFLGILGALVFGQGVLAGFSGTIFFLSGVWITFAFPAAYEKALKNKTNTKII